MKKTVLVTGSSRGIGKEIALLFAKKGDFNVVINYKENETAARGVFLEASKFCECLCVRADVRISGDVEKLKNEVMHRFGGVDVLVNNAGVAKSGMMMDMLENEYDYVMDTNLKGSFLVTRVFLGGMVAKRWGRVINVSSILGVGGASCEVVYSASKAGMIGMTKALAKEVGGYGVRVNAVAPGLIDTDMIRGFNEAEIEEVRRRIVVGRVGTVSDVAAAVMFLAGEGADYISGQVIGVDGGLLI